MWLLAFTATAPPPKAKDGMTSFLIFFFFPGKAENKSLLSLTLYKGGAGSCKLSHRENRCVMLEGAWDQREERSKEASPCSTPPCQVRPSGLSDTPFYKWGTWSPADSEHAVSQFIWPPHPVGAAHSATLTVPGTYLEKQHGRQDMRGPKLKHQIFFPVRFFSMAGL